MRPGVAASRGAPLYSPLAPPCSNVRSAQRAGSASLGRRLNANRPPPRSITGQHNDPSGRTVRSDTGKEANRLAGLARPDTDHIRVRSPYRADSSSAFNRKARHKEGTTMAANDEKRQQHWAKTRNLTIVILILWAIFSFVLPWNAHDLNAYKFIGFPLGFYFTAQGSLIAFVLLIWIQNMLQDKIDDEYGMGEE
jgi:putative solute:sodium symporter small subunit